MNRSLITRMCVAVALLLPLCLSGCLDFAETTGIGIGFGSPEGDDGYTMDYKVAPADAWDAFRTVARANGEVDKEDPERMELSGKRINRLEGERVPDMMRGRVVSLNTAQPSARLIVHVWEPGAANDAGLPETARAYCFAVQRELERRRGGKIEKDPSVVVGTEPPVQDDEAVGYFKVTRKQAFDALKQVMADNGEVTSADEKNFTLSGMRKSTLEPVGDGILASLYDRTEQDKVRVKVSVRVRTKQDDKPRQDTAKAYIKAVREALEKAVGGRVDQ